LKDQGSYTGRGTEMLLFATTVFGTATEPNGPWIARLKHEADLSPPSTHSLIPQSRILLEKITVTQLGKKFTASHASRKSITIFTRTPKSDAP
jgi:hypothetical protein